MVNFKVYAGQWSQAGALITGVVDATLSAYAVTGSETDANYVFDVTVTPDTEAKVGLIVNHTLDEDWNESYLVLVLHLDTDPCTVTLEAVTRDAEGNETSRQILASRNMTLTAGTPYNVRVETQTLGDGAFAVYGYIGNFRVVEAEDLAAQYSAGQRGFEILGDVGDSAQFLVTTPNYCQVADVKPLLHIDLADTAEDAELAGCVITSKALVDGFLQVNGLVVPAVVPQLVVDAAKNYAAWDYRRRRDPVSALEFWNAAQQFLQAYVDAEAEAEAEQGPAFKVGQA